MAEPRPLKCPRCNFKGTTKADWIKHLKESHPEIEMFLYGTEEIDLRD